MKKVILVDGNNLLFRSYYATAYQGVIMRNSKGFPTNALYGFLNMMNKIIHEEKPNYILVAFDKGKTFRHDQYSSYKAGRIEMPDDLRLQFPRAKEILDAMGIYHYEIENYEADDIIGTVSKIVDEEDQFIATIISSDKDLLQLISDEVDVKLLKSNSFIRMDKKEFKKQYKVDPIHMIDLKSLMGDASDNIPGVKGIGEKTAINLLSQYETLDNLYQNIDNITGKTKEKLENDRENAYMSYDLATIYREVQLDFSLEDLKYQGMNKDQYVNLLKEFEFNSLLKKIDSVINPVVIESSKREMKKIEKRDLIIKDIRNFNIKKEFSYYIEVDNTNYSKSQIIGIGLYDGEAAYYIYPDELEYYKNIFCSIQNKFTYDLKKSIFCLNHHNIKVKNTTFDLMIAAYLLNYTVKDDIAYLARKFKYDIELYETTYGTDKKKIEVEKEISAKRAMEKAKFIYEVKDYILEELEKEEELSLFENIEMPLSSVLADMELTGVKVDGTYLDEISTKLKNDMDQLTEAIYQDAGCEFNIMSPKQLSDILFEKLEIKYPKRIKNNKYSTSKDILDKIIDSHPIVSKILDYRTVSKLYTNYAVGLKNEIREDGRIHTVFTQTLTRTGRLSSICPNLQNIPASEEYSKLIRSAFIPDDNSVILSSDYSQVELRIFASMSNATNLIDAFKKGIDIHTKTASDIYHVELDEVTKEMRRTAKAVNFGILYGISSFGLSEDLGIDIKTAKQFINNYLNTYPGITEYMEQEKKQAYELGYVKTLMNRKRIIDELKSKSYLIRSGGERIALNTPIQGTAADILKKAMIEIYDKFSELGLKSKMIIQVHDELVFNVVDEELEQVKKIVKDIMENTYQLNVPLKAEIEYGKNWYEAK
ncbi:MAG: DNA polymerase I [Bacilli bacterium]|nr:DNA polymerase I [Bacilli bacterium]